jgi:hypothetical protein
MVQFFIIWIKKKYVWYPQGHNARSKFFFVVDSEAVPGGTAGYNT